MLASLITVAAAIVAGYSWQLFWRIMGAYGVVRGLHHRQRARLVNIARTTVVVANVGRLAGTSLLGGRTTSSLAGWLDASPGRFL